MFWIGFVGTALIVFILAIIYSSLYMAKKADEENKKNDVFSAMEIMLETSDELVAPDLIPVEADELAESSPASGDQIY